MKARVYCTYKYHPIELRIVCLACLETHFCFPCSSMLTFKQNSTKRCCACALYLSYSSLHIANSNKSTNIQQTVAGCRASLSVRVAATSQSGPDAITRQSWVYHKSYEGSLPRVI